MKDIVLLKKSESLLPAEDINRFIDLSEELSHTVNTVQRFRTRTEMQVSVINDLRRPTPDSKYWQAVREQNAMYTELLGISFEYRRVCTDVKIINRKIATTDDELMLDYLLIDRDQKLFHIEEMKRTAKARMREIIDWSEIKKKLKPMMQYSDTDPNPHQLESIKKSLDMQKELVTEHTTIAEFTNIKGPLSEATKLLTVKEAESK